MFPPGIDGNYQRILLFHSGNGNLPLRWENWRILITSIVLDNIYDDKKYYTGEPVKIHIQSLINMIQENNWEITTKKGQG